MVLVERVGCNAAVCNPASPGDGDVPVVNVDGMKMIDDGRDGRADVAEESAAVVESVAVVGSAAVVESAAAAESVAVIETKRSRF